MEGKYSSGQMEKKNYSKEGRRVQNMPPQNKSLASGLFGADYLEKLQTQEKL